MNANEVFDANGNGLNDNDFKASQFRSAVNNLDKVPIPVTIEALIQIKDSDEKHQIGSQTFGTVKLVGIITNFETDETQSCATYTLIDIHMEDIKMAPTFTVIRYQGVDFEPDLCIMHERGTRIQTVGKLRLFNDRLSLISFYIREINDVEIEIFKLEAKLASIFYKKNIFERSVSELEELRVPLLSGLVALRNGTLTSQFTQTQAPIRNTFSEMPTQKINTVDYDNYRLLGQQAKVVSFIKQNGANECGVSIDEIITAINPDNNLLNDLNYLLGEGVIYNTLDENHFSVI